MKQFSYVIKDKNGIHARPAGLLVKEAQKFKAEFMIEYKSKAVNLKKLFALMSLGVKQGDTVTVTISGDEEVQAAQALETYIKDNF